MLHDVAIYSPFANVYYDAAVDREGGGAERQTFLLARALARRGMRVAHVVYPVAEPRIDADAPVTLVQWPQARGAGSARALAARTAEVWQALGEADAAVQVFRGAQGTLGVAGAWSRLHRRRLVFAGANDEDFTGGIFDGPRDPRARLFGLGMRLADAVVVQTADQVGVARDHFPRLKATEQVNSFVNPGPPATDPGEAFLWVSRLADYKRPLLYADLAAAVPEARFWMLPIETAQPWHHETLAELRRRSAGLGNLELLDQRPHAELQQLIGRAVAMVNTSAIEGMPNTWLEGWARGVPAMTLSFDPDERIVRHGLGVSARGSWEDFVGGARDLWKRRADRCGYGPQVRAYVADVHGEQVAERWAALLERLGARQAKGRTA